MVVWKNRKVKNWWDIEEGSVSGDCKDEFANEFKGGIGKWKLTEVEEWIFGGECRGEFAQKGLWKWRSTYHFAETSVYFVLKIELLLNVLSNFEREWLLVTQLFDG